MSCSATILDRIIVRKRQEVADRQSKRSINELKSMLADQDETRGFIDRLVKQAMARKSAVIAEIKRASPSKGLLRADFQPAHHAQQYDIQHMPTLLLRMSKAASKFTPVRG